MIVQLTPAPDLICYRRISVIANVRIKEKLFKGLENRFCFKRISITGGSARAVFDTARLFARNGDGVRQEGEGNKKNSLLRGPGHSWGAGAPMTPN